MTGQVVNEWNYVEIWSCHKSTANNDIMSDGCHGIKADRSGCNTTPVWLDCRCAAYWVFLLLKWDKPFPVQTRNPLILDFCQPQRHDSYCFQFVSLPVCVCVYVCTVDGRFIFISKKFVCFSLGSSVKTWFPQLDSTWGRSPRATSLSRLVVQFPASTLLSVHFLYLYVQFFRLIELSVGWSRQSMSVY